jgi:hypothetical protein
MRIGGIRTPYPSRTRACGTSPLLSHRPIVGKSPSGRHQRKVDLTTVHSSEPQVNSYPASEQKIWEVERGRICNAILATPPDRTLSAGDSMIFAPWASSHALVCRHPRKGGRRLLRGRPCDALSNWSESGQRSKAASPTRSSGRLDVLVRHGEAKAEGRKVEADLQ